MSIKEIFNQNRNHEKINKKIVELEKSYLKINALEVRLNRLLKLEEKVFSLQKVKKEADRPTVEKLEKLFEKVNVLEASFKMLHQKIAEQERVQKLIWRKQEEIQERIKSFSSLSVDYHQTHANSIQSSNENEFIHRLEFLEANMIKLQNTIERDNESSEEPIVIREIHIDKFYLDKYEQNNNIGQIGIKELSGALNIGATFGKDTIPKEMNDQLREYFDEVIAMKKEKGPVKEEPEMGEKDYEDSETDTEFTEISIEEEEN